MDNKLYHRYISLVSHNLEIKGLEIHYESLEHSMMHFSIGTRQRCIINSTLKPFPHYWESV